MERLEKKGLFILCLALSLFSVNCRLIAQEETETIEEVADSTQNRMCSFVGGTEALIEYLKDKGSKENYPIEAWDSEAQGRVYLAAEVQEDGSLDNIRVLKKVPIAIARAAFNVAKNMPKWLPALKDGKPVKQMTSFCIVYKRPEFKYMYAKFAHPACFKDGGLKGLMKYLGEQVKYPPLAYKLNIGGRVMVGFMVMEDGSIKDIKIVKGVNPLLEAEAIRVVESMPKWIPAQLLDGTPVPSQFTLPVVFHKPK